MPIATIYCGTDQQVKSLSPLSELQNVLATKLSCSERNLLPKEVSIRVLKAQASEQICDIDTYFRA
ncbi:MAG TPA: hypothetical protein VK158_01010 [Acidobacteriota bacterium]|nr:hypothetical protein [Acidobacteriota bacterium]